MRIELRCWHESLHKNVLSIKGATRTVAHRWMYLSKPDPETQTGFSTFVQRLLTSWIHDKFELTQNRETVFLQPGSVCTAEAKFSVFGVRSSQFRCSLEMLGRIADSVSDLSSESSAEVELGIVRRDVMQLVACRSMLLTEHRTPNTKKFPTDRGHRRSFVRETTAESSPA